MKVTNLFSTVLVRSDTHPYLSLHWPEVVISPLPKSKAAWEIQGSKRLKFEYCAFHRELTKDVFTTTFV